MTQLLAWTRRSSSVLRLPPSARRKIWSEVVEPAGERGLFATAYHSSGAPTLALAATAFVRGGGAPTRPPEVELDTDAVNVLRQVQSARREQESPANGAEALLQLAVHGHHDDVQPAVDWLLTVETRFHGPYRYHRDLARRLEGLTADTRRN